MTLPNFPNFLSRAKSIGMQTVFMTAVASARNNVMRGNYFAAADDLNAALNRLYASSAYTAYAEGVKHARTATAGSMMEDLCELITDLKAYAAQEAQTITEDELFTDLDNNENA